MFHFLCLKLFYIKLKVHSNYLRERKVVAFPTLKVEQNEATHHTCKLDQIS